jgi:hypothetical protein
VKEIPIDLRFQKGSSIRFLEFARESITDIFPLPDPAELGLGLSPDYRNLLQATALQCAFAKSKRDEAASIN